MAEVNQSRGIFASDVFLRTSLISAWNDLRESPIRMREIFAGLAFDELTQKVYGEKEIQQAIDFITENNVTFVNSNTFISNPKFPAVVIKLLGSDESANTLNDVHSLPTELVNDPQFDVPDVAPISFDLQTGEIVLPADWIATYGVSSGMTVTDANGKKFTVDQVFLPDTILLKETNIQADFSKINIAWDGGNALAIVGSAFFKESYQMTLYTTGEPFYSMYLYSLVEYLLLSTRDELASRGMDISSVRAGSIEEDRNFSGSNLTFARNLSFECLVQKTWYKRIKARPRMAYISQITPV